MTQTTYNYQATDFANNIFALSSLNRSIRNSDDIQQGLKATNRKDDGSCDVKFKKALGAGEKTVLDAIVAAHDGVALGGPAKNVTVTEPIVIIPKVSMFRTWFTDSSGSHNINVDGSTTPVAFSFDADAYVDFQVNEVHIILQGEGMVGNTSYKNFGNGHINGLTNGILFQITLSGVTFDWFLHPIKKLGQFFHYQDDWQEVESMVTTEIDMFSSFYMQDILLRAGTTDKIEIIIQDDLSNFNDAEIMVTGHKDV